MRRFEHPEVEGGVGASLLRCGAGGAGRAGGTAAGAAHGQVRLLVAPHVFTATETDTTVSKLLRNYCTTVNRALQLYPYYVTTFTDYVTSL